MKKLTLKELKENYKLVISASTKEVAEKMLNDYCYSVSYRITENGQIVNNKGVNNNFLLLESKNRFRIYQKN